MNDPFKIKQDNNKKVKDYDLLINQLGPPSCMCILAQVCTVTFSCAHRREGIKTTPASKQHII